MSKFKSNRFARPVVSSSDDKPLAHFRYDNKNNVKEVECFFCTNENFVPNSIEENENLDRFVSPGGNKRILPRKVTGLCAKHQRYLSSRVKRGRVLGFN